MAEKLDFTIDQLISGEKRAWDAFVDRFSPVIYSAVRRTYLSYTRSVNEADVNDTAQEVFLRLIKNDCRRLKSYNPAKASLSTWLTIVSRSVTIDSLRKRRLHTVPLDESRDGERPAPSPSPPAVEIPPGLLSPRQKLVLGLFFDRGLDVREIAAMLNIKEQTVRSARHKALKRLRKYFENKG